MIEELTLEAPLVLTEDSKWAIQVAVGSPDGSRRGLEISSRRVDEEFDRAWTRNASGFLTTGKIDTTKQLNVWPPLGADKVSLAKFYGDLARIGFDYGAAFQNVQRAWKTDDNIWAEVTLGEDHRIEARRYRLHPALFDSAVHVMLLQGAESVQLPFSWSDVRLAREGLTSLRVCVSSAGAEPLIEAFDEHGQLVFSLGSVTGRPVKFAELNALSGRDSLFEVEWIQLNLEDRDPATQDHTWGAIGDLSCSNGTVTVDKDLDSLLASVSAGSQTPNYVLVEPEPSSALQWGTPESAREAIAALLPLLQQWITSPLQGSRLLVVTHNGMAVGDDEDVDPVMSAIWGLMRSAISENPEHFSLLDLANTESIPWDTLASLLDGGERQLAVRDGIVYTPRLRSVSRRAPSRDMEEEEKIDPLCGPGTVLITGGTGGLGGLIARHLAAKAATPNLLLLSRSGRRPRCRGPLCGGGRGRDLSDHPLLRRQ